MHPSAPDGDADAPRVVITLPAYRAEGTLEQTIADIPTGLADEIILVDDASPDGTAQLARGLGLRVIVHHENRGYGGNQKTCYREALESGADIVVMLHPDYQYDPKAVPLLIAPILAGDADMTFGSRFAGLGDPRGGGMPRYRFVGNRITTSLENLLLGSRFTDMHSGLRAYTARCLTSLPFGSYSDGFVFDTQLLVDAVTTGQRVVEVPIPTRYTAESSSISIARSLRYVVSSLAYTARRWVERGRRGRRSPVRLRGTETGRILGAGPAMEHRCVLCGRSTMTLVFPATAQGSVPVDEFACTTGALSEHDDIVQCPRCGMVSSIPTLDPEEIVDRYVEVVDEVYLDAEPARRELFAWILGQIAGFTVPGRRLLEIGSNVGLFLQVAAERGWEEHGIEPSTWAVNEGTRRFGVRLQQGSIEDLEVKRDAADVVVMLDVLEHLNDPLSALKRLRGVINEEGLLVLSTVNLDGLHARYRGRQWPWFIRSHLHYFSERTLSAMLRAAGFRLVEWKIAPRSFPLSYIAGRAAAAYPRLGAAVLRLAGRFDPEIPVGWLGDITFVAARPAAVSSGEHSSLEPAPAGE
ncbi:MAG TPA: bifunctional glycosyltransferase/class I SAM-dependent methyltransferase [Actinomycetota bacterium]|jgi:2-polyprenyl-3-methyl-5-hydroxy-6-metoxy-1,4-benzoquinol methylase|nr:bifunctional glycosyltransferase/class I SAM-dependent methyltransferase [Actinomycetota bacterium]